MLLCVCIHRRVETELNAILVFVFVFLGLADALGNAYLRVGKRVRCDGMFAHTGTTARTLVYRASYVHPLRLLCSPLPTSSPACR